MMQAKEVPGSVPRVSAETAGAIDSLRGGGQSLSVSERAFFEPRFGQDFSNVRLHTDARAAGTAHAVNAKAYTIGNDVVFGSGYYAPGTDGGRRLLAHELVHTMQQSGGGPRRLQRMPAVETDFQSTTSSAAACLVHLHGDERTAFAAAQNIRSRYCTNLVFLRNSSRCVDIAPGCKADPNRIFDTAHPEKAFTDTCPCPAVGRWQRLTPREKARMSPTAVAALRARFDAGMNGLNAFIGSVRPALATCRGGTGAAPLPVVAFHNNTPGAPLSIDSYSRGGNESAATETDRTRLTPTAAAATGSGSGSAAGGSSAPPAPVANPNVQPEDPAVLRTDHDNFFLTTQPADFFTLRGGNYNVVLQSTNPPDDGSLSVALRSDRYINFEVEDARENARGRQLLAMDITMGEAAMASLRIPPGPCAQPAAQPAPATGSPGSATAPAATTPAATIPAATTPAATTPAPMPRETTTLVRETAYTASSRGCRGFVDQTDFDAAKARWAVVIARMPVMAVLDWMVGRTAPPAAARREAQAQLNCMLAGLRASARANPTLLQLPSRFNIVRGYASDAAQSGIWNRKFRFEQWNRTRAQFDRITPHAVSTCGPQIGVAGSKWDPYNDCHRVCWGVLAPPASGPCMLPGGARPLNDDERQQEILEASSAPGISRHHYGTDFDLFSVEPSDWQTAGPSGLADEHSWLARNASSYGFVQSFTPGSAAGMGYMPEDWHWSYMPIAQALLEFARTHENAVSGGASLQDALMQRWGPRPEFSYIRHNWRGFVFNVNQTPTF